MAQTIVAMRWTISTSTQQTAGCAPPRTKLCSGSLGQQFYFAADHLSLKPGGPKLAIILPIRMVGSELGVLIEQVGRYFKLKERKAKLTTELRAGLVTFLTVRASYRKHLRTTRHHY